MLEGRGCPPTGRPELARRNTMILGLATKCEGREIFRKVAIAPHSAILANDNQKLVFRPSQAAYRSLVPLNIC